MWHMRNGNNVMEYVLINYYTYKLKVLLLLYLTLIIVKCLLRDLKISISMHKAWLNVLVVYTSL